MHDPSPSFHQPGSLIMSTSLRGVNLAGGEWAYAAGRAPVEGQDYQWVSHRDIDYLDSKGVRFVRLLFSWEILQPQLNQAFDPTYEAALRDRIGYASGKGISVLIEPHGGEYTKFARYKGDLVGSPAVPDAAFADLWRRLADTHRGNALVGFGLMNEPNGMSTAQWFGAAQAAIDAIRGAGAANLIFVPGNGFSQPESWNDDAYDSGPAPKLSNAAGWARLNDPLNNAVVSVHTYFDADGGGGTDDIADPAIIGQRLQPVVDWARPRGLRVHLSEFGANAAAPGAESAVANALAYLDANADVMTGWSWWAYGPPAWWGAYRFTLCPSGDYAVDDPKMAWLAPHFAGPPGAPTLRPASVTLPAPADASYSSKKTIAAGAGVPAGTYTLKTATRTTYSDQAGFCVEVILENPSDQADIDWTRMTIDLRGHALGDAWNCTITGTSGIVAVEPMADTKTVRARSKTAFGFCVQRSALRSKAAAQVRIKSVSW